MGLGYLSIATPLDVSFDLAEWLDSDDYLRLVEHFRKEKTEPNCLLDVIGFWIARTDAVLAFPTFQTFLLAVLEIVNEWLEEAPLGVFGRRLWPDGNGGDGLIIDSLAGYNEDGTRRDVMSHAIMREENFLLHQTRRRNKSLPPITQ